MTLRPLLRESNREHLLHYLKRMLEQMLNFVNDAIKEEENANNVD